jgi:hypothetical protein
MREKAMPTKKSVLRTPKNGELKLEMWPVSRFVMYEKNPRKNDAQIDRMVGSIQEFGFRLPVLAKSDGLVVDGHLRIKAAQRMGIEEIPVILADGMTDAQIKAFRLLANKSANWAEWDIELLAEELNALESSGLSAEVAGFTDAEADEIKILADIELIENTKKDNGIDGESMGVGQVRIKVVLPPGCLDSLEKAILATGMNNRAQAVKHICEMYLEER